MAEGERICKNCCMWDCEDHPCKDNKALKPDGTDSCIAWGYFNQGEKLTDGKRVYQYGKRTTGVQQN